MLVIGLVILLIIFLIWSDSYCKKELREYYQKHPKEEQTINYNSTNNNDRPSLYETMRRMGMWD